MSNLHPDPTKFKFGTVCEYRIIDKNLIKKIAEEKEEIKKFEQELLEETQKENPNTQRIVKLQDLLVFWRRVLADNIGHKERQDRGYILHSSNTYRGSDPWELLPELPEDPEDRHTVGADK